VDLPTVVAMVRSMKRGQTECPSWPLDDEKEIINHRSSTIRPQLGGSTTTKRQKDNITAKKARKRKETKGKGGVFRE